MNTTIDGKPLPNYAFGQYWAGQILSVRSDRAAVDRRIRDMSANERLQVESALSEEVRFYGDIVMSRLREREGK